MLFSLVKTNRLLLVACALLGFALGNLVQTLLFIDALESGLKSRPREIHFQFRIKTNEKPNWTRA